MWHEGSVRLTAEAFDRAAQFIVDEGRPLEVARFAVHFEDGDLDAVDDELSDFQNEDGGFGNALEPDLRCPESSVAATTLALRILSETGAPPSTDLVENAVDYLVDAYDSDLCGWVKVPPEVNDHPHAPWWRHPDGEAGNDPASDWDLFNVQVLAQLYDYSVLVPEDLLEEVTQQALATLAGLPDALEMHAFKGYLQLASRVDSDRAASLVTKLTRVAETIVVRDPARWGEYVPGPLWIAPSPSARLAGLVAFNLDAHLDHLLAAQQPNGTWLPPWRWGEPAVWAVAEKEWSGILTLEALLTLREFGRIEGF